MIDKLIAFLNYAWEILGYSGRLIAWNLFLAFIPLALSVWLFRLKNRRSWLWWSVLLVFIAFLPNAPYVLTDTIHLVRLIRFIESIWVITLVLIPQYVIFILSGFLAYCISIINLGYYLQTIKKSQYIFTVELIIHGLSAVGIYLGRFLRFNSWDFVTQPHNIFAAITDDLMGKKPLLIIVVTFLVLTILYAMMKEVILAITARRKSLRAKITQS